MKTYFTLFVTLLISISSFAQTGINYKAVVKDNLGSVIANQSINVRFTILVDGGAGDYIEKHTNIMTDANGIIIVNIGEGNEIIQGDFNGIDWTSNPTSLKTEIDIERDGTFEDLGTTAFKFVPYAIQAIRASEADNVSGLEQITEGSNTGWRLIGADQANYGNIGKDAIDLSFSNDESTEYGATADYSVALGYGAKASGDYSMAMGYYPVATGEYSMAMGRFSYASGYASTARGSFSAATGYGSRAIGAFTEASGTYSTAMGRGTLAFGDYSTAMGQESEAIGAYSTAMGTYTTAQAYASTAIGRYNVGGGNATAWESTSPIFEIGIGSGISTRANAMTVFKNGNVGIGTTYPTSTLHVIGDVRIGSQETIEDGGSYKLDFNATLRPMTNGTRSLGDSEKRWSAVYATNGTINTSDLRDKESINDLSYGLNEIMLLRPVSYTWKDKRLSNGKPKLGLIAQEVQAILNEVVQDKEWIQDEGSNEIRVVDAERMGIYYSDLIPVLIKAIQQQQQIIDGQNSKIDNQNSKINTFESSMAELTKRMTALEAVNNQ